MGSQKRHIEYFFNKFEMLLHKAFFKYGTKKIVIAGDFNINMLETNPNTIRLKNILKKYNLNLHINQPTRKNSCIDLIISNIQNGRGSTIPLWLSDHDTVQILKFTLNNFKRQGLLRQQRILHLNELV